MTSMPNTPVSVPMLGPELPEIEPWGASSTPPPIHSLCIAPVAGVVLDEAAGVVGAAAGVAAASPPAGAGVASPPAGGVASWANAGAAANSKPDSTRNLAFITF